MLTSRPTQSKDVDTLRLRLKEFLPKLVFCTTHEAEQQLGAFLDGYGAIDYVVDVEVDLDGSTMIKIGVQLKDSDPFFFVPLYLAAKVEPVQLPLF